MNMNKTMKRKLIALGLSVSMVSSAFTTEGIFQDTAIVSAKSTNTYRVNSYGVLTKYSGSGSVYIRANVSALTTTVFDSTKVTSFTVDSNNKYFKSVDGVLYTKDGKKLVRYPSGKEGAFIVPGTVTSIAQDAFRNCNVSSIQIPNSVSAIGNAAFYKCKKLQTINIPSTVTALRKNMFYQCRSLKSVALPSNLTVLGTSCFEGCSSLESVTLPASLKKVGDYLFNSCKSLTKISIPKKLKCIPSSAFHNCTSLKEVSFGSNIELIDTWAFSDCTSLESVIIPGSVDTIETSAFEGCTSLRNVTLKNGLSDIERNAFFNCRSLENIKLPNSVNYLGSSAFGNCTNLQKAILSDQLRSLQFSIFENCSNLKSVQLPKSLTQIEECAFAECSSLTTVRIPKNVAAIKSSAFLNSVTAFIVDGGNKNFSSEDGVLYDEGKSTLLKFPSYKSGNYKTPDTVKTISSMAFRTCHKIKNVTIGEGITKLHKFCFEDSSVEEISLPSTLQEIKNWTEILDAPNLESINISANNESFSSEDGILYTKDKTILCIYPAGKTGNVTFAGEATNLNCVPAENKASKFSVASGSSVYAVDDGMLTNLKKSKIYAVPGSKTSYHMGRSMRNIDALNIAKYALNKLSKITVNAKNTKYSAKDGVLFDRYREKIIYYPNAKKGTYTTPSSVTNVKADAFSYASKLNGLTIGKNVSKCNLNLTDCEQMKTLVVKEGDLRNFIITTRGTTQLKKVKLPTSLITAKIYCSDKAAKDLTIVGWTNTCAERLAKRLHAKFVSVGIIPRQLKNVKIKAYVNLEVVKISWDKDPQVSGYEIYSDYKKLKTITDNSITETSLYVGDDYYSALYIRSYIIQNGKKIYGKPKKMKYYPYSE